MYESHILIYQKQQQPMLRSHVLLSLTPIHIFNPLAFKLQLFVRSYVKAECGCALCMCDVRQTKNTINLPTVIYRQKISVEIYQ